MTSSTFVAAATHAPLVTGPQARQLEAVDLALQPAGLTCYAVPKRHAVPKRESLYQGRAACPIPLNQGATTLAAGFER